MAITIKIIDKNSEPFTFKNVEMLTEYGSHVRFTDEHGVEHITNAEYHVERTLE